MTTTLNNTANNIIQNGFIEFSSNANTPLQYNMHINFDKSDTYGALRFNTTSSEVTKQPLIFHYLVDVSGSMSDRTRDGRSKIRLIIHTLTNMFHYYAENSENVFVQVSGFDNTIHSYIKPTMVTSENVNSLINKLSRMRPMNLTNIELALTTAYNYISDSSLNIPKMNQVVILLTDGYSNMGEICPTKLVKLIQNDISSHFIALGDDHDTEIMYALGHQTPNTSNWLINNLEHTGNVYGEILFNETHKVLYDVNIRVKNGKIFDYLKGKMVDDISIGTLSSEMQKEYHIISNCPDVCEVVITGTDTSNGNKIEVHLNDMPPLISRELITDPNIYDYFIEIQYLRMGVQKLMADVRLSSTIPCKSDPNRQYEQKSIFHIPNNNNMNALLDKRISEMKQNIEEFIDKHNLFGHKLLNGLIDDLAIILNTSNGNLIDIKYITAREDSQGRQTCYVTETQIDSDDDDDDPPCKIQRSCVNIEPISAYSTPSRINIMRSISGFNKKSIIDEKIIDDINDFLSQTQDDTIEMDSDNEWTNIQPNINSVALSRQISTSM
jgi:hypothetical protein